MGREGILCQSNQCPVRTARSQKKHHPRSHGRHAKDNIADMCRHMRAGAREAVQEHVCGGRLEQSAPGALHAPAAPPGRHWRLLRGCAAEGGRAASICLHCRPQVRACCASSLLWRTPPSILEDIYAPTCTFTDTFVLWARLLKVCRK